MESNARRCLTVARVARTPGLVRLAPEIEPFAEVIRQRQEYLKSLKQHIDATEGSLVDFARGHETFGLHRVEGGVKYREWAPNAVELSLVGEFNDWQVGLHKGEKDEFGVWTVFVPNSPSAELKTAGEGSVRGLKHKDQLRVHMVTTTGESFDRIPAWIPAVCSTETETYHNGLFWDPSEKEKYEFQHEAPRKPKTLRIYEAHVGMSGEQEGVNSYSNFTKDVLPKIKEGGYNAIQLMGVQEHALYSSFGYQVHPSK